MHIVDTPVRTVYTNREELTELQHKMPKHLQDAVKSLVGAIECYYEQEDQDREISFNDWDGAIFTSNYYKIEDFDVGEADELIDWFERHN